MLEMNSKLSIADNGDHYTITARLELWNDGVFRRGIDLDVLGKVTRKVDALAYIKYVGDLRYRLTPTATVPHKEAYLAVTYPREYDVVSRMSTVIVDVTLWTPWSGSLHTSMVLARDIETIEQAEALSDAVAVSVPAGVYRLELM